MVAPGWWWRWLRRSVVGGGHVLALAAPLAVPVAALLGAAAALREPNATHLADLVGGRRWLTLLANTGVVVGVAVAITWGLGGALALLTVRTDLPGRRLLLALILLAACMPLHASLVFVFAAIPLGNLAGSVWVCGALYGLAYTPLATLILAGVLRMADRDLEDLALLDGGPRQVAWRVTLPLARGGFAALAMLMLLLVGTDPAISDLLGVRTFAEEIRTQYALRGPDVGPLLSALPLLIVLGLLLVVFQARHRLLAETREWDFAAPPRPFRLAGRAVLAPGIWLAAALVFALLIRDLLHYLRPLRAVLEAAVDLRPELGSGALVAAGGATLTVLPAAGLAWAVVRGGRLRGAVGAALVLLLATPAPVVGITLITLLNHPDWRGVVYDSPLVIVLTYYVRFLPLGVLLLVPAVQRIPREVELAARLDGCDWWAEHWRIRWPAIAPAAAVAWLVLAVFCFAEVAATVLVVPPAVPLASVRAFTLLHFGVYRDLAVLALLSSLAVLLPWAGLLLLWSRVHREVRLPQK